MKAIVFIFTVFSISFSFSQVGINTTSPDASAALDINSNNQGILVPRVNLTNTNTTSLDGTNTAATGLLIYNTNTTVTGGNGVGFYVFNGTNWEKIAVGSGTDTDWYIEGTSNPSTAITDNIYTQGNVEIDQGSLTIDPIDDATGGLSFSKTIATNTAFTLRNFEMNTTLNGTTSAWAFQNRFSGTGTGSRTSFVNQFSGSGAASSRGFTNNFSNNAATFMVGFDNNFNSTGTGIKVGFDNSASAIAQNGFTGLRNNITGGTAGSIYGVNTTITNGSTAQYGSLVSLTNGTGTRYGFNATFAGTGGGTDYGFYAEVPDVSGGYASYMVGRASFGNTTSNRYNLPAADGTNGQVMTTDGAGNITFENPASSNDADFFEAGTTIPPNAITDNIYTLGNLAIGKNTADHPLDIDSTTEDILINTILTGTNTSPTYGHYLENNNNGNGTNTGQYIGMGGTGTTSIFGMDMDITATGSNGKIGYRVNFSGTGGGNKTGFRSSTGNANSGNNYGLYSSLSGNGNGNLHGVYNVVAGTGTGDSYGVRSVFNTNISGIKYGTYNRFNGTSSQIYGLYNEVVSNEPGNQYGVYSTMNNLSTSNKYGSYQIISGISGNGDHYGTFSSLSGAGSGEKYGSYNLINSSAGGIHYGVYSDAQNTTGYAGYFIGRTSLGTGTTNRYLMPATDGTNGQVMTTDGAGNASWATPSSGGAQEIDDLSDAKTVFRSVYLGNGAGANDDGSDNQNTAIGNNALNDLTSGIQNVAVGESTLLNNTTGQRNTVVGQSAMRNNTSGSQNTVVGEDALYSNTTGSGNVAIGQRAGRNSLGSNRLYIENSDSTTPLIYGEFDNDILRANGTFQVGNPATSGYALPTNQGAANQVLTTAGDGTSSWSDVTVTEVDGDVTNEIQDLSVVDDELQISGGGTSVSLSPYVNPIFPDGYENLVAITHDLSTGNYTVPANRNLYITNSYGSSNTANVSINGILLAYGWNNSFIGNSITLPIIAGAGDVISGSSTNMNGFLVDAKVTPVIHSNTGTNYTVPAGNTLVIVAIKSNMNTGNVIVNIDGTTVYNGAANYSTNSTSQVFTNLYPFYADEGAIINISDGSFNGYLIPK